MDAQARQAQKKAYQDAYDTGTKEIEAALDQATSAMAGPLITAGLSSAEVKDVVSLSIEQARKRLRRRLATAMRLALYTGEQA